MIKLVGGEMGFINNMFIATERAYNYIFREYLVVWPMDVFVTDFDGNKNRDHINFTLYI